MIEPFSATTGGLFWVNGKKKEETLNAVKKDRAFHSVVIVDEQFKVE